ncbi:glycosyltransferase family 2 protein [Haloplanus pelagicus]|uniref:glycosyltransferase family 2 protein n=1 Tax=Haloplanus pelagicus TaxID=2949995 RepID=UPI00203BCA90|nr:glycosyltransferase [Haloplanus sp. HW8-1]
MIVPTIREDNVTFDTIPSEAERIIRRDEGLNVARNAGVRSATNDWIVIADDDIEFPTETVAETLDRLDDWTLAGLRDFEPLRWVIGRLLIFHRNLWERVGGFDESRHHGGDTDFAIRVEKAGGRIYHLDRDAVPHHDVDTGESMAPLAHLEWLLYLTRRHPRRFGPVAVRIVLGRLRR